MKAENRFDAFWPGELALIVRALRVLDNDYRHVDPTKEVAALLAQAEDAFNRACLEESREG